MKSRHVILRLLLVSTSIVVFAAGAEQSTGTLVVDVKAFTSEIDLKEKVEKDLKTGGLEWGLVGNEVVLSLVNKRYVGVDLPNFTRYGQQKTVELRPGDYKVTCIVFQPEGGFSIEKTLKKGAFFNLGVLGFTIQAGKTTTLEILPTVRKKTAALVAKIYFTDLLARIVEDGSRKSEQVVTERTGSSIAWEDYKGPLKL